MRKLVFGIFAVGCLQAAFLFYNSADIEDASMRVASGAANPQFQVNDPILSTWPRTEVVSTSSQVKAIPTTIKQSKATVPVYQRAVDRRPSVVVTKTLNEKRLPAKTPSSDVVFASNVIGYDDSLRIDKSKNKRSFASKSFSVIKKPYDWLKALGSKFN